MSLSPFFSKVKASRSFGDYHRILAPGESYEGIFYPSISSLYFVIFFKYTPHTLRLPKSLSDGDPRIALVAIYTFPLPYVIFNNYLGTDLPVL